MLANRTARPSESSWSSPLHLAPKKDNSWRPCGDYRALNARTILQIQDFTHQLAGSKVFSKIDLIKAYNQIPVQPADIHKTVITTPFELYEFPFMTFGLRSAAQTFQRFMDEVLRGLSFCYCYSDDLLLFSQTAVQHTEHMHQLFKQLSSYGILINTAKCDFGRDTITFEGLELCAKGVSSLPEKVQAIQDYPAPKTAKDMRRFLGIFNFYRRFVPNAARLQSPLNVVLTGPKTRGTQPIVMTNEMKAAFDACKQGLASSALLVHPPPNNTSDLAIFTDVSDNSIGTVFQQKAGDTWNPLAFFSNRRNIARMTVRS